MPLPMKDVRPVSHAKSIEVGVGFPCAWPAACGGAAFGNVALISVDWPEGCFITFHRGDSRGVPAAASFAQRMTSGSPPSVDGGQNVIGCGRRPRPAPWGGVQDHRHPVRGAHMVGVATGQGCGSDGRQGAGPRCCTHKGGPLRCGMHGSWGSASRSRCVSRAGGGAQGRGGLSVAGECPASRADAKKSALNCHKTHLYRGDLV